MLHENCSEFGITLDGPLPAVRRQSVTLADGRALSVLVWGTTPPELVLLHGGAQNAHTWDTVAIALKRPLVCIDLPSHGHSDTAKGVNDPRAAAEDVAAVLDALAPSAKAVVGMSFGGLTAIALSARRPDLVRRLVLVDVTPGVTRSKAKHILEFVGGPESFASFDELLARTIEYNPTRSTASLRRGILHNAMQRADGSWVWRHARFRSADQASKLAATQDSYARLWDQLGTLKAPCMLVRGMRASSVVDDADEADVLTRLPRARIERLAEAGHSVQGDMPVELAELLASFVDDTAA